MALPTRVRRNTAKDTINPPSEYASIVLRTSGLASTDSLLGNLRKDPPNTRRGERRAKNRQRLMRKWRSLHSKEGIGDEEGRNYCLAKIRLERGEPPRLVLDLGVVTYGQIPDPRGARQRVRSLCFHHKDRNGASESHHYSQSMRPSTVLRCLPWRRKTHQSAGSPTALFIQPYDRAASVGVTVVTIETS